MLKFFEKEFLGIILILLCSPFLGIAKNLEQICSNPTLDSTLNALESLENDAKSIPLRNASGDFRKALSVCKPQKIPFGGNDNTESPTNTLPQKVEPIVLDSPQRKDALEKAKNFERAVQQLSPQYQSAGFKCLEEHGICKADGKIGDIGCAFGLVICWAPNVIPLTGDEK